MIQNVPVGENLQEHVFSNIEYTTETDDIFLPENIDSLKSTIQYTLFGTGNTFKMKSLFKIENYQIGNIV